MLICHTSYLVISRRIFTPSRVRARGKIEIFQGFLGKERCPRRIRRSAAAPGRDATLVGPRHRLAMAVAAPAITAPVVLLSALMALALVKSRRARAARAI